MKKFALAGCLILAFVMSSCASAEETANKSEEVVVDYRGGDLYCLTWDGSHGEVGMTCDFERFYKENSLTLGP